VWGHELTLQVAARVAEGIPMHIYRLQYGREGAYVCVGWVGDEASAKAAIAHWTREQSPGFMYEAIEIRPTKAGIVDALNRFASR
jgi:hypothetical protein